MSRKHSRAARRKRISGAATAGRKPLSAQVSEREARLLRELEAERLENLRPLFMHCKCGKSFRYKTNVTAQTITHTCLNCKAPVDMELNSKGNAYVTVGVRKGQA